jgi:hypothetical protein
MGGGFPSNFGGPRQPHRTRSAWDSWTQTTPTYTSIAPRSVHFDLGNVVQEIVSRADHRFNQLESNVYTLKEMVAQLDYRNRVQDQTAMVRETYLGAQSYTNVVMGIGYAGYFTLWGFVKGDIDPKAHIWSAILIAISLTVFVIWELVKMMSNGLLARQLEETVGGSSRRSPRPSVETALTVHRDRGALWWPVALAFTLVPAALGVVVLFYGLLARLLS